MLSQLQYRRAVTSHCPTQIPSLFPFLWERKTQTVICETTELTGHTDMLYDCIVSLCVWIVSPVCVYSDFHHLSVAAHLSGH